MIFSEHMKQRMEERRISSYVVDVICKVGEFNSNSERLIVDKHQEEQLEDMENNLKREKASIYSCIKQISLKLKMSSREEVKEELVYKRRSLKNSLKRINKNLKDLEKMISKKHTLVLSNNMLITVFN